MSEPTKAPFTCGICKFVCDQQHVFNAHFSKHKEYRCDVCMKIIYEFEIISHALGHQKDKPHCCGECRYRSMTKLELDDHIKRNHVKKPPTSDKTKSRQELLLLVPRDESEASSITDRPFQCGICNWKFIYGEELDLHMKLHGISSSFEAVDVGFEAASTSESDVTGTSDSRFEEKPFHCGQCKFKCRFEQEMEEHAAAHEGKIPIASSSKIKFSGEDTQKKSKKLKKEFNCEFCDYKTLIEFDFNKHRETHDSEKKLKCNICKIKFHYEREMIEHIESHKRFQCQFCETFVYESERKRHMIDHNKNFPFSCDICVYRCRSKLELNDHKKKRHELEPHSV